MFDKLSRAEEITSEVRRLVMTCRSLEAQLQQSVPKKTHQEMVTKMQAAIDGLSADLGRTKKNLEETETLGGRLNALTSQISTQNEIIGSQNKTIESFSTKMAESTVPIKIYSETAAKAQELEQRIQNMVQKPDYDALQSKISDLESQISSTVPRDLYSALEMEIANCVPKSKFEELESRFAQMVSKEEYNIATSRVAELENSLSNSIPKVNYEELQKTLEQTLSSFESAKATIAGLEGTISNSVPKASFAELQSAFEQTVPRAQFETASQRIAELENTLSNSVSRASFIELQGSLDQTKSEIEAAKAKVSELESALANSVPSSKFEELQSASGQMIPKEQYTGAVSRITELEQVLANSVPRSDFEKLTSTITSLTREMVSAATIHADALTPSQTHVEPAHVVELVPAPVADPVTSEPVVEVTIAETPEPVSQPAVETATAILEVENGKVVEAIKEVEPATSIEQSEVTTSEPIVEQIVETFAPVEVQATIPEILTTPEPVQTVIELAQVVMGSTSVETSESQMSPQPTEIREVQSQLSEISGAQEAGEQVIAQTEPQIIVDNERGFRFSNTEICAKSGLEFLEDLEKVDLQILEQHCHNGDFERWFKEVLADESSAESLRSIREKNSSGEELRTQMLAVITSKYRN